MKKIGAIFLSLMVASSAYAEHALQAGSLTIKDPYARATVVAQKAGGGFMKIENTGAADQLIGASSPVAKRCSCTS